MYKPIYFNNFDDYLDYVRRFDGGLISPGAAANKCGVARASVHHWMYKGGFVRSFIYEGREGKYILIPVDDVDEYWSRSEERLKRESKLVRTSSSVCRV